MSAAVRPRISARSRSTASSRSSSSAPGSTDEEAAVRRDRRTRSLALVHLRRRVRHVEHARGIAQQRELRGAIADDARELIAGARPGRAIAGALGHPAQRGQRAQIVGLRLEHRGDHPTRLAQPAGELERLGAIELPARARGRIVGERAAQLEHLGAREQRDRRRPSRPRRCDVRRSCCSRRRRAARSCRRARRARAAATRWFARSRSPPAAAIAAARRCSAAAVSGALPPELDRRREALVRRGELRRFAAPRGDERRAEQRASARAQLDRGRERLRRALEVLEHERVHPAAVLGERGAEARIGGLAGERGGRLDAHDGVGAARRQIEQPERGRGRRDVRLVARHQRAIHIGGLVEVAGALERARGQPRVAGDRRLEIREVTRARRPRRADRRARRGSGRRLRARCDRRARARATRRRPRTPTRCPPAGPRAPTRPRATPGAPPDHPATRALRCGAR